MSHPDTGMAGSEREKQNRPIQPQTTPHTTAFHDRACKYTAHQRISSSQRTFWPVWEFGQKLLAEAGIAAEDLHPPGTAAWVALDDDDPAKILACVLDSPHHTARVEAAQAALDEATRAVSAAADWRQIARESFARSSFRAAHLEAKRVAS